ILRLLLDTISIDEMADTLFSMMSTVNAFCKLTNMLLRKKQIDELMDMLRIEKPWTKPGNKEENVIYNGFNDIIGYVTVVEPATLLDLSIPIIMGKAEQTLPLEVWTPYNHSRRVSTGFRTSPIQCAPYRWATCLLAPTLLYLRTHVGYQRSTRATCTSSCESLKIRE
ncbi:hypothetical protein TSAR_000469, partial [Trichomalopsis sarcophagae]